MTPPIPPPPPNYHPIFDDYYDFINYGKRLKEKQIPFTVEIKVGNIKVGEIRG